MKQKRIPLVGEQYLVPFILITSLFFLWGFAHAILDVLNKHFQELLDITKAHSAFIQAMMYMGYFIMAIPAGLFISRFGYRRGVVFGLLLYGIGSLLFIPGQYYLSFNMFLFALFVIGCGLTFLETAANPYATELGAKETAASRLNFAQSFNGLGCICAPVLAGLLLFSEDGSGSAGNVALPYVGMGIVVLLVALVFSKIGGQYMNEVEYCHIKDYEMPELAPTNPGNDYGPYKGSAQNHNFVIRNVVNVLSGAPGEIITTNVLEGMKVVDIIRRIYAGKA